MAKQPEIAVLADTEPDGWVNVEITDTPLLQRCLDIMRIMSKRYEAADVSHRLRPWMAIEKGTIAYYLDANQEIVLPYAYKAKHRMYDITSFGFLSSDVQGISELTLTKLRKIIALTGVSNTLFAGVPASFDYPGMQQFLAMLPTQPGVQVTVLPVAADFTMWRITV